MSGPSKTARESGDQDSQVLIELPVAEQRRVSLEALQALGHAFAGNQPGSEERKFAAGDEDHTPRMGRVQRCCRLGRCDQSGPGFLQRVLEEGRGEPHLESESERDLSDNRHPSEVTAHDPHGVGVQVVPDDLELAPHHRHVECRRARRDGIARAAEHGSRVVVDSLVLHVASILAPSRLYKGFASPGCPEGSLRGPFPFPGCFPVQHTAIFMPYSCF